MDRELQRWTDRLHARGYYEARASHGVLFPPDGAVLSVTLTQGPLIRVAFAGDALDEDDRERLVPIRAEASADEDLLEDSSRAIEAFLKGRGLSRRARGLRPRAGRRPTSSSPSRSIGARATRSAAVRVTGNASVPTAEIRELLRVSEGDAFSEEALGVGRGERARRPTGSAALPASASWPART